MVKPSTTALRTAGRPRDGRIDRAVLEATVELLERDGYGSLTIGAIAQRAGTTKTAIYRRWPTKAHLVHEAAFPDVETERSTLASGDGGLAAELRTMLATGVELLGRPATRAAIPGLLVEYGSDAQLQIELRQRFIGGSWKSMYEHLDRAIIAGEVRPDTDPSTLVDLIGGAAFLATTTHAPDEIDDPWIDSVVGLIMRGIAP
jgi:AcrR family transcriptional regulator